MKANEKIDAARIDLLLGELRLPGVKLIWAALATTADKEGWPAARFLAALAEQEMVERKPPPLRTASGRSAIAAGKDPRHVRLHRCADDLEGGMSWRSRPATPGSKREPICCASGRPVAGKTHLAAALGLALIEKGWRVLFTRTTDLVQKLQIARRDLVLEAAIAKLDKYHLLILDDLAYVRRKRAFCSN